MGAIIAWLARLGPWLRGLLPAGAGMIWKAWSGWQALKLGKRLLIIGVLGSFFPVPEWVQQIPGRIAAMPEPFHFFVGLTQLQFGFYVIMSAYTTRWVWKIMTRQAGGD